MQRLAATLSPQLFAHAHDAFIALDAGGAVTAWSPAAERLYGYTAAEVAGRSLDFLRIPEEASVPTSWSPPAAPAGARRTGRPPSRTPALRRGRAPLPAADGPP